MANLSLFKSKGGIEPNIECYSKIIIDSRGHFTGVVFIHAELQKITDIFGSYRFYVLQSAGATDTTAF